ncbi:high mobility group protein B3-like isoform X2 [Papaver somniferum]|uniref:high mobility group protein B3-like isoform X2 n=1 Tax=Papaver somniferum TaxID=3469 RepID=UPI000E701CFF|nr:high mobility group protein B3-like isoform X2 [Papaver somniferum]
MAAPLELPASAFFIFMEEFSETFKHEHPNYKSFAIVGKAGGDKWRSMSPAERGIYEAKAEARRTHYVKNIQAYDKKMGKRATSDEDESDSDSDESEEVMNSLPDTVEPRRPASAFFCFMEDFRHTYKNKHPNNKSVSAVGKAGGDKWRSLSDAEKAPYVAEAEKRKAEYNKHMCPYCKKMSEGVASDEDESESDEDNESEEVDRDRPKRPASAYFIFMEKFSQAYKEKHPNNRSVCVVGKAGGDRWKSMSDSEKAPYVAMEKQRKIEYLKYWEAHEKKAVSPWELVYK